MHLLSPYEHLHGFNAVSLRRTLQRAGLVEAGPATALAHPRYMMRRLVSTALPYCGPTFALARFGS
jgi:hypothetical protein